jgi:hypothetical protein
MKPVFFYSPATISMELQKILDSISCSWHLSENNGLILVYTVHYTASLPSNQNMGTFSISMYEKKTLTAPEVPMFVEM